VWVYASDLMEVLEPEKALIPGLLPVIDARGIPVGTALWSPHSQIALRLVSEELLGEEAQWLALLERRLRGAIDLRRQILEEAGDGTNACRLVFSEADALPGLVIDQYGDLVLLQLLVHGLDTVPVRETVTRVLREELEPAAIIERSDPRIRELEQLSSPAMAVLYANEPDHPCTETSFRINGLKFHFDAKSGQKTGAFLDQRLNYAAAAHYGHGEALDVCTYQGGFALHLARSCSRVTGVDVSRAALEVAERNLQENRDQLTAEVDWLEANAFDLLREWSDAGTEYDTIVLDPPAFAKSKRAAEGAVRGYKELNLRAFKMLRPGGVLVTCSCSHHVPLADFTAVVAAAAADAGRRVRLLERRGAAPDHPAVLTLPETEYLKCLICVVD
jgi:23S rRNA (cytosine1962-C5)-methyltransferase